MPCTEPTSPSTTPGPPGRAAPTTPGSRVTRHLVCRAGAGVDVGAPQLCRQQVIATEDVERQVAVAVVVTVAEAPPLVAVQRVVGGVEVGDQPLRRLSVGVEEEIDEEPLDRAPVVADAAIAVGARGRVLRPVQRRLARKRRTARPTRLQTPRTTPAQGRGAARRGRSRPRNPTQYQTPAGLPGWQRRAPHDRTCARPRSRRRSDPPARSPGPRRPAARHRRPRSSRRGRNRPPRRGHRSVQTASRAGDTLRASGSSPATD